MIEIAGGVIIAAGVLFVFVAFFPFVASVLRIGAALALIAAVVAFLSWRTPPTFWLIVAGICIAWTIRSDYNEPTGRK